MNLNELIKTLVGKERDKEGIHVRSSLRPQFFSYERCEYFDTLARLILGKGDVCIAMCCHNDQLLYSSNRGEVTNYADNCLNILKKFANNSQKKSEYLMLVDKVIGKVLEVDSSRTTGYKEIATFKNAVMDYNRKKDNQDLSVDDKFNMLVVVNSYAQVAHDKIKENKQLATELESQNKQRAAKGIENKANRAWDCLVPWHDLNTIVNAIKDDTMLSQNSKNLIRMIKEGKFRKINSRTTMHAEMKLIDHLIIGKANIGSPRHIGISKLACCPCQVTINALNKPDSYDNCFCNCGTHGGTYHGWAVPTTLKGKKFSKELRSIEKELQELTQQDEHQMFPKVRETTSKIPSDLAGMPIFGNEEELNQGQLSTQIQIPPK